MVILGLLRKMEIEDAYICPSIPNLIPRHGQGYTAKWFGSDLTTLPVGTTYAPAKTRVAKARYSVTRW